MTTRTYTFHISGTHCPSCKIFIEDTLNEQIGIDHTNVDLKHETVSIDTTLEDTQHKLAAILTEKIRHNGYSLSVEKKVKEKKDNGVIWQALPIGLVFLSVFFLLQKTGILNFGIGGQVTPVTSFIIGLIASVSSCLAVVGGLVLSLSAKISQDTVSDKKNIFLFHLSRIVGFAILWWFLWALWHVFEINYFLTSLLGILAALVMILLGADLMGIFHHSKITLPVGIFEFFKKIEHKTLTPIFIGFGTFFLPCGFTQSMQIAALSSSSIISGGLIMTAFALGTFPVLALLSFGVEGFSRSKHAPLFFASAGVVVLGLGIFALLAWLAWFGIIPPIINL